MGSECENSKLNSEISPYFDCLDEYGAEYDFNDEFYDADCDFKDKFLMLILPIFNFLRNILIALEYLMI